MIFSVKRSRLGATEQFVVDISTQEPLFVDNINLR